MINELRQAEKLLAPLVDAAEKYKADGGRKAGTILSKVKNAHARCVEGIAVIDSVVVESEALSTSPATTLTKSTSKS